MKIANSKIDLFSTTLSRKHYEFENSIKIWQRKPSQDHRVTQGSNALEASRDKALFSEKARLHGKDNPLSNGEDQLSGEDRLKIILVEKMVKMLTGKDIEIKVPSLKTEEARLNDLKPLNFPSLPAFAVEYESNELYYEMEALSLSAEGSIQTADGQSIRFEFSLELKREYLEENHIHFVAGNGASMDPLVINFGEGSIELGNRKYQFDLNGDGLEENMPFVKEGGGFLALDKNMDGIVNDGYELFGPESGNGFYDLALYDSDGNGWIDEGDPVFGGLKIWTKDEEGKDFLYSLSEKNIGAIYLNAIRSNFTFKEAEEELGKVTRSGIAVGEDGTIRSIMQIDLKV